MSLSPQKVLEDVFGYPEFLGQQQSIIEATLQEMLMSRPRTNSEMLGISGVGQTKLDRYGDRFLSVLRGEGQS